jgi:hypothetical protein
MSNKVFIAKVWSFFEHALHKSANFQLCLEEKKLLITIIMMTCISHHE